MHHDNGKPDAEDKEETLFCLPLTVDDHGIVQNPTSKFQFTHSVQYGSVEYICGEVPSTVCL